MRALVVADGDVPARASLDESWPGWDREIGLVIAADGGWLRALTLGLRPDLLVGDGDSLRAEDLARVREAGVPVELAQVAKDESDAELAVLAALRRGATSVTILGALGGPRVDHALANVWLLALPALSAVPAELLDGRTRIRLLQAPNPDGGQAFVDLAGEPDDLVTLLPFGGSAEGITTVGLRYPLVDESLVAGPARGLSNVLIDPRARVCLGRGRLLLIETKNQKERP